MDSHTSNTPPVDGPAPGEDDTKVFLDLLLARDEGGGGPAEALLPRLRTALMHCTELHALRERKTEAGPVGHRTVRHIFLLADGGCAVLWEVEYHAGRDRRTRHALHADQAAAEAYVRERFGEPPVLDLWPEPERSPVAEPGPLAEPASEPEPAEVAGAGAEPDSERDTGPERGPGPLPGAVFGPSAGSDFVAGSAGVLEPGPDSQPGPESFSGLFSGASEAFSGSSGALSGVGAEDDPGADPARLIAELLFAARRAERLRPRRSRPARHDYRPGGAAEHARRLLRRAENLDRPGEPVRRLLAAAVGHETTLVTLRHDHAGDFAMDWSLYEHAFLLADGIELSLWEVEHTINPHGNPVCEVYLDEATARDSVDRHRAGS
jgi:Family of unknown function (DUF6227)